MNAYFKPVDGGDWQPIGGVIANSLSLEDPYNHYESAPPHEESVSFTLDAKLTKEEYRKLFKPYPKLPRKLKKEIKSFRRWLGMSYKKCSRLELIRTCCLLWDMAPGHEGVRTPAWLTRTGFKLARQEVNHESLDC